MSALQLGATIFQFERNSAYQNIEIPWRKIEEEKVDVFGTCPKFLPTTEKSNLSSLKVTLSTGLPLAVEYFERVYKYVKIRRTTFFYSRRDG